MEGRSIKETAKSLGIHPTLLNKIEAGREYIPPKWRRPLAEFFNVQVEAICDPQTDWPRLIEKEKGL